MEKILQETTESSKVPPSEGFREAYILHLADNSLILGQRNSEWCGHGPILEQDIAITNISLDLIGQARNFYQYAAELINESLKSSESKAPPSEGFGEASMRIQTGLSEKRKRIQKPAYSLSNPTAIGHRQFSGNVYSASISIYYFSNYRISKDEQIAAIATKSLKEVAYHLRWSKEWVIRLGDGTEESHNRMMKAIDELWRYTGEMFMPADYEKESGVDFDNLKNEWRMKK